MFEAKSGAALLGFIAMAAVLSVAIYAILMALPSRARKPLIALVTFISGAIYALEWFWPVGADGKSNFMTPYLKSFSDLVTVLQGFALGIGVWSILTVHLRRVAQRRENWGFSVVLLSGIFAMAIPYFLNSARPNRYNQAVYAFAFDGAYNALNATMYSVVAFYIVSAAYRAFRIRSVEATVLLGSAALIMLGQISLGQALTIWIPNSGFAANFRVENAANWILEKINSPALQAVELGIGVGALAMALRLWLSLERGSYFEEEV
ncbi:MAG: hypothetical protein QM758_29365 [Armatimonas sp.]